MRTPLTHRTSALLLAGALAVGGAACNPDDESGAIDDGAELEVTTSETEMDAESETSS